MLFSYKRPIFLAAPESKTSDFQIQVKMFQEGETLLILTIAKRRLSLFLSLSLPLSFMINPLEPGVAYL